MPLETADWISELVATNPEGSDVRAQGDDHIRLVKDVMQKTLPDADRATSLWNDDDLSVFRSEQDLLRGFYNPIVLDGSNPGTSDQLKLGKDCPYYTLNINTELSATLDTTALEPGQCALLEVAGNNVNYASRRPELKLNGIAAAYLGVDLGAETVFKLMGKGETFLITYNGSRWFITCVRQPTELPYVKLTSTSGTLFMAGSLSTMSFQTFDEGSFPGLHSFTGGQYLWAGVDAFYEFEIRCEGMVSSNLGFDIPKMFYWNYLFGGVEQLKVGHLTSRGEWVYDRRARQRFMKRDASGSLQHAANSGGNTLQFNGTGIEMHLNMIRR